MSVRTMLFAIAALTASAGAAQQYSGNDPRQGGAQPPAPVVLASADARRPATPANAERPPEPARRPAARVTTCRCGDPQPEQDPQDQ